MSQCVYVYPRHKALLDLQSTTCGQSIYAFEHKKDEHYASCITDPSSCTYHPFQPAASRRVSSIKVGDGQYGFTIAVGTFVHEDSGGVMFDVEAVRDLVADIRPEQAEALIAALRNAFPGID